MSAASQFKATPEIGLVRLQSLIDFMEGLPESKFDFSDFVTETNEHGCGTVCCAAGWLPQVDPEHWQWSDKGIKQKHLPYLRWSNALQSYFGLNELTIDLLFSPGFYYYSVSDSTYWRSLPFHRELRELDDNSPLEDWLHNAKIIYKHLQNQLTTIPAKD